MIFPICIAHFRNADRVLSVSGFIMDEKAQGGYENGKNNNA